MLIREVVPEDVSSVLDLIKGLAEYEKDLNAWSVYSDSEIYFVVRGLMIYFFTRKEEE